MVWALRVNSSFKTDLLSKNAVLSIQMIHNEFYFHQPTKTEFGVRRCEGVRLRQFSIGARHTFFMLFLMLFYLFVIGYPITKNIARWDVISSTGISPLHWDHWIIWDIFCNFKSFLTYSSSLWTQNCDSSILSQNTCCQLLTFKCICTLS